MPVPCQSPVQALGNMGHQQGLLSTLEKGCAGGKVPAGLCHLICTLMCPTASPEPRSDTEPSQGLPRSSGQDQSPHLPWLGELGAQGGV